jgi:site-specific recombinase XerD
MNIKFNLTKNKKNYKVSVRVYYKNFDVSLNLDLFAFSDEEWNFSCETFRDNPEANEKLLELKSTILKRYNRDFTKGVLINKSWLQEIVKEVFDRPTNEVALINNDKDIYIVDFSNYWLKTFADSWKTSPKETMSKLVKSQYQKFIDIFSDFQDQKKVRYTLYSLTQDDVYELVNFLEEDDYNSATIERYVGRLKFFLNRAAEMSLKVSQVRNQRIYIDKESSEVESVYLNEEEIKKIYNLDLSHDFELDNARDNLVISCFSGLRVSDLMVGLNTDNIKEGFISVKTKKTKTFVTIPVHSYCESILRKRFGQLPKKTTTFEYNRLIRIVCQLAEIDNQILAKTWNPLKKRKEIKYVKKYEAIGSHTARRSFASNLYGKVPNEVIQSVAGWSSSEMLNHYNKISKKDYAEQLKDFWNK